jgi:hypothetical protein
MVRSPGATLALPAVPPTPYRRAMATARLPRSEPLVARALPPALAILALSQLALAVWMVAGPGSFYDNVGGFGARNDHYLRDVATFEMALAVCAGIAVRRPSWRVPVLAFAAVQFTLHAINHVADAGDAVASTSGWADAIELAAGAALFAWLLWGAIRRERG